MSAWCVRVDNGTSRLFSGRSSDIDKASLDDLLTNPDVVCWDPLVTNSITVIHTVSTKKPWIHGAMCNKTTGHFSLFAVQLTDDVLARARELAESGKLSNELAKAYFGLQNDFGTLQVDIFNEVVIDYPGITIDVFYNRQKDRRRADPNHASTRVN